MKSIIYKSLALAALLTGAASCTNDLEYTDTTPSPVQSFYEPVNGKSIKLIPSATASVLFEWQPCQAGDGAMPQYELAFYKADDTTTPIYTVTSDANGAKPMATVNHKTLTKVMALAGVQMGDEGTVKWGVISYAGVNGTPSKQLNDLTMTRFIGFDEVPAALYLAGAASETGDDLAAARPFAHPDGETFEMFTSLKGGQKIVFITDPESPEYYSPKSESAFIDGAEGGYMVPADGVYRLTIDFSTASVNFRKINGVYFRFTHHEFNLPGMLDTHCMCKFDYQGGGVFTWEGSIKTKATGWSWDPYESRHNFAMEYADGAIVTWGPKNSGLDNKPSSLEIESDNFTMVEYAGRVGYKWKVPDAWYDVPLVYTLYFNDEHGAFKHFAKVK